MTKYYITMHAAPPPPSVADVRRQYEALPYPPRNPDDDRRLLRATVLDDLRNVNRYAFRGRRDFDKPLRILVAGGGTGDASTCLAVQIARMPRAEIVYLDLSDESMHVARRRLRNQALRLGLPDLERKVEFRLGSLLDLDAGDVGRFDYINCSGVLHHLDDPDRGLDVLAGLLHEDGAMGLMVYADIGRTSVYPIRDMMRILNKNETDPATKIESTLCMLRCLPDTNLHVKYGRWLDLEDNPAELYDLYLHERDVAFTFPGLMDWIAGAGLNFCQFTSATKAYLMPEFHLRDLPRTIRARLEKMSPRDRIAFTECLVGSLNRYEFYVARRPDAVADPTDWNMVPSFSFHAVQSGLKRTLRHPPDAGLSSITFPIEAYPERIRVPVDLSPTAMESYRLIDDARTIREIVVRLKSSASLKTQELIRHELFKAWHPLVELDMLQFRHVSSNVRNLRF